MRYEKKNEDMRFIAYLDENDKLRKGYFKLIHHDASFCKFESEYNIITVPTIRVLKIKEKKEVRE